MTDEDLMRANEIKREIKAELNKLEILDLHKEGAKSNCCSDSEIKIQSKSDYIQNFSIYNEIEVIDVLDFLIDKTRAKIKKLEEEFENL